MNHLTKEVLALEKEMAHLKGLLQGKELNQALLALNIAKKRHEGQFRKSGEPYIVHPIRVCTYLTALKIYDDSVLATALLHDVPEDCKMNITALKGKGFDNDTIAAIDILTKKKDRSNDEYYEDIFKSVNYDYVTAGIVKLSDRCNNISTMAGAFTSEKIKSYIEETEEYTLKLCSLIKGNYPEYSDAIFVMKYNLESMIKAYKLFLSGLQDPVSVKACD